MNTRYKTLYYGLKRNHPHMAAITHPLIFLVRRVIYAAIVLFMINTPIVGIALLAFICVGVIAFVIVEQQWEDTLIAWQHVINEVALYLILMLTLACALPLPLSAVSPIGWLIIGLTLSIVTFNLGVIAFYTLTHGRLYVKRNKRRLCGGKV